MNRCCFTLPIQNNKVGRTKKTSHEKNCSLTEWSHWEDETRTLTIGSARRATANWVTGRRSLPPAGQFSLHLSQLNIKKAVSMLGPFCIRWLRATASATGLSPDGHVFPTHLPTLPDTWPPLDQFISKSLNEKYRYFRPMKLYLEITIMIKV